MARARGGEALTREAEEALFALAERMTEGSLDPNGQAWFGTAMFTVELSALRAALREDLDPDRLSTLVEGSVRFRIRALRLACADVAHRHPERSFGRAESETQVRVERGALHVDLDLRWPLAEDGHHRVAR